MPDTSTILSLPLILPAQAQKHVTHNEALRLLDLIVQLTVISRSLANPPAAVQGDRYIVPVGATGVWAGQAGKIALYEDGLWQFVTALAGWQAWVLNETALAGFTGTAWATSAEVPLSVGQLGVSATADATNRLAVSSPATLLNHAGAGHQLKLNKAAAGDTASLLFQSGFSGRAEMGTMGNDDFGIKVSPDGAAFFTAMTMARADGQITFPAALRLGGQASDPVSPANGTIWLNTTTSEVKLRSNGVSVVIANASGGVTDGDKGDISVSGAGVVWTIDTGVVGNAKLAAVATATLKGRQTAGSGVPEDLTAAQARAILNVADGATANATDAALRDRSSHTGTQTAATISDFAAGVAGNAAVAANTAKVTNAAHTGDVTGSAALTLATVNTNVGAFGSAAQSVALTVNAKGLITAAAQVPIAVPAAQITDSTAAGRAVLTSVDALAQRTALGLGSLATQSGTFAGTSSGTNTGDQTSIAGIVGTKAQFNAAVSDGDIQFVGDAPTVHTHLLAAGATDVTITAANLNALDDGLDTALHFHTADRARGTHTETQPATTISDFASASRAQTEAALVAGANLTITPSGSGATRQLMIAATGGGATNLGYNAALRVISSDTCTDATLPLLSSGDAGLAPASGGGTANFLRADGTWSAPAGGGGGVTDGAKGDVIVSGGGTVWTLDHALKYGLPLALQQQIFFN